MRTLLARGVPLALAFVALAGCQSTPKTVELPPVASAVVEKDFETAWQDTREVLLQQQLQIYTRDKRGLFIAFTPTKRVLLFYPRRTKLTVSLEPLTPQTTRVSVETIKQHYSVTLLTYPDWRDVPKGTDPAQGQVLLDAIVAHTAVSKAGTSEPPQG